MKHILNFGSLNIDHVYRVGHFVRPGESLACRDYERFAGGKGFNQSIALARAGVQVTHVGGIGRDGNWLTEHLAAEGVNTKFLQVADFDPTGHAMIQVTPDGENAIVTFGGANRSLDTALVSEVLEQVGAVDMIVLQNETNVIETVLREAHKRGLPVAFNPAPLSDDVRSLPFEAVSILVVNEVEAAGIVGEGDSDSLCDRLVQRFPGALCVLTEGSRGSRAAQGNDRWFEPARSVTAIDTTAAGDTFIGFFVAEYLSSNCVTSALLCGNQAAALAVTRAGAAESIPTRDEIR